MTIWIADVRKVIRMKGDEAKGTLKKGIIELVTSFFLMVLLVVLCVLLITKTIGTTFGIVIAIIIGGSTMIVGLVVMINGIRDLMKALRS